jgi:hypothetical protein
MPTSFRDIIDSNDIMMLVQSNLLVWEGVSLSLVCKDLYAMQMDITRGDFEQVKNKYYANLQLLDLYKEWETLLRMKANGLRPVFAPNEVTYFFRKYNKNRCV